MTWRLKPRIGEIPNDARHKKGENDESDHRLPLLSFAAARYIMWRVLSGRLVAHTFECKKLLRKSRLRQKFGVARRIILCPV